MYFLVWFMLDVLESWYCLSIWGQWYKTVHWFYNIQGPRGWFVLTLVILNCCHGTVVGWICYYSIPIAVFRKLQKIWGFYSSMEVRDCFQGCHFGPSCSPPELLIASRRLYPLSFSSLLADLTDKSMPLSMWRQAHALTVRVEWVFLPI